MENVFFYDELRKVAALRGAASVGLAGALLGGTAAHLVQRPTARNDRVLEALHAIERPQRERNDRGRSLRTGATAVVMGAGLGAGYEPARRKVVARAAQFVHDTVEPTMAAADATAAGASKRLAKDISDALASRAAEAGKQFGDGAKESLLNSTLGRFLRRGG